MGFGRMELLAASGPTDAGGAQRLAEQLGSCVGPIAGFVLCLGGGWLLARNETTGHVARGAALGAMVAVIDVAILVASGAGFRFIFAVSNVGRIVAGSLAGWLAGTTRATTGVSRA